MTLKLGKILIRQWFRIRIKVLLDSDSNQNVSFSPHFISYKRGSGFRILQDTQQCVCLDLKSWTRLRPSYVASSRHPAPDTTIFLLEVWKSKLFAKIFFDLISRINWPKLRRIFHLKKRFSRLLVGANSRLKKIGSGSGAALKIWLIRPSLAPQHWSFVHIAGGRSCRWSTRTGRRPRRDWRTCSWPSQILRLPLGSTIGTVTFVFKKVMWYQYFSRWNFPF